MTKAVTYGVMKREKYLSNSKTRELAELVGWLDERKAGGLSSFDALVRVGVTPNFIISLYEVGHLDALVKCEGVKKPRIEDLKQRLAADYRATPAEWCWVYDLAMIAARKSWYPEDLMREIYPGENVLDLLQEVDEELVGEVTTAVKEFFPDELQKYVFLRYRDRLKLMGIRRGLRLSLSRYLVVEERAEQRLHEIGFRERIMEIMFEKDPMGRY